MRRVVCLEGSGWLSFLSLCVMEDTMSCSQGAYGLIGEKNYINAP